MNTKLIDDYLAAKSMLRDAVKKAFPYGSWVLVKRHVVGRVHAYGDDPQEIHLILEHGYVRVFTVETIELCPMPKWAKCYKCQRELNSDRFGRDCPQCETPYTLRQWVREALPAAEGDT